MAKASKGAPPKAAGEKPAAAKPQPKAPAKGAAELAKPAAKAPPKAEQLSLGAETAAEETVAPPAAKAEAPPRKPASEGSPVVELVIGAQGTWKKLASGKKVQIDEKEWQVELARMLAKKNQVESPPTEN